MHTSLFEELNASVLKRTNKDAVVFYGKRLKFGRLLDLVNRAATGLRAMGVKEGSVVTLLAPNTPSAMIAFYSLNRLGAIISLVHPFSTPSQLTECVKKTNSCLIIAYDLFLYRHKKIDTDTKILKMRSDFFMGFFSKAYFKLRKYKKSKYNNTFEALFKNPPLKEPCARFNKDDAAVYLPSGGTLGEPKIVMHPNRTFSFLCQNAQFFLSENLSLYKTMYSVLPIFHGFGLCMCMHMSVVCGMKNVMSMKFNPNSAIKAFKKEHVNLLLGVPAMFSKLLKCKRLIKADLSSLKDCFVGGDSVSQSLIADFNSALKRGKSAGELHQGYGLTETVAACTVNNRRFNKEGSAGKPLPQTEIKIVDGEICIKSPLVALGYYGGGAQPFLDIDGEKWLKTGDLGYLDGDFLFFSSRAKNLIKINGVNIFPKEIETVIEKVRGVKRAAVFGNQDGITAVVECETKNTEELKEQILLLCQRDLIFYAVPKEIQFRKIPLNNLGKINISALREEERC